MSARGAGRGRPAPRGGSSHAARRHGIGSCRAAAALLFAAAAITGPAAAQSSYQQRYAAVCAACHGERGSSTQPLTPHLGGQPSFYVITQLFLFREGRRNDHPAAAAMGAVARGMSDADLRGFSEFVATLPPPAAPTAPRDEARFERGRQLAGKHHCTGCHGGDLAGGQQVPRVAGQREDYLLIALQGFRAGQRLGYTNAMGEALAGLGPQDLADLAHHLAHAGPGGR